MLCFWFYSPKLHFLRIFLVINRFDFSPPCPEKRRRVLVVNWVDWKNSLQFLRVLLKMNRNDCTFLRLLLAVNWDHCSFSQLLLAISRDNFWQKASNRLLLATNRDDWKKSKYIFATFVGDKLRWLPSDLMCLKTSPSDLMWWKNIKTYPSRDNC